MALRAQANDLDGVAKRPEAARPRGRADLGVQRLRPELIDAAASLTYEVMVMGGRARRVAHAAHSRLDTVNARQRAQRHEQVQRAEDGGASDATPAEIANDLLGAKGLATPECRCDHRTAR